MQNNLADTEAIIATTFLILKETSVTLQRIFEIADFVQISSDENPFDQSLANPLTQSLS